MFNAKYLWTNDRNQFCQYVQYSQTLNDVHPHALTQYLPQEFPFQRITNKKILQHLNAHLRKKLDVLEFPLKNLESPLRKWLLLPLQTLLDLQHLLGALFFAETIKKVVMKRQHEQLTSLLGTTIYECILKRASLFMPLLPCNITPKFSKPDLSANIIEAGQFFQEYCLCNSSEPLLKRFTLKFNPTLTWNFEHRTDPTEQMKLISLCNLLINKELK
ncbi:MAG: SctK family type III secretion system sorting platform protein [Puniceicoccales bacterium]|nr:SctK family type III secretion system sorting platform protein [Puniceicoccales bacterium]